MRNKTQIVMLVLLLGIMCVINVNASEPGLRTFQLPSGVTLSIPEDWTLRNVSQLRAYERRRDKLLDYKGITSKAKGVQAHVPIQAMKQTLSFQILLMMTILPGEATQQELIQWSEEGSKIQELGALLGEVQSKSIAAAGAHDIKLGPAELREVGNKKAVFFSIEFTGPNGIKYVGDKYFIYTKWRTIVLSFQTSQSGYAEAEGERTAILRSLKIE